VNLNKLTRDQLIELIKKIESQNSRKTKESLFQRFIKFLIIYRDFVLKLTIVALTVKIFRKYSILKRIWRIFNSIIMSIFGISMLDIYGTDIFYNFFKELYSVGGNIVDYLSKTHFYSILRNFFEKDVEGEFPESKSSENETGPLRSDNSSSQKISNRNNENKTNSSRFGEVDQSNQSNQEQNPFYKDKYFIFGAILIISGLFLYLGLKPSRPSNGDNVGNLNREQLQDRLQKLLDNKPISDNTSEGSDLTVTQVNNYFNEDNLPEVNEFIQGSSTDLNSRGIDDYTSRSIIPKILLSSRFLEAFNSEQSTKEEILQDKEDDTHEVKIQEDDSDNIIDTWDKVEVKFLNKDNLNILFGRMSKDSKSILINTSNNQEIIYDLSFDLVNNYTNDNFNWRTKLNSNESTIKINKIMIVDLDNKSHLIYLDE